MGNFLKKKRSRSQSDDFEKLDKKNHNFDPEQIELIQLLIKQEIQKKQQYNSEETLRQFQIQQEEQPKKFTISEDNISKQQVNLKIQYDQFTKLQDKKINEMTQIINQTINYLINYIKEIQQDINRISEQFKQKNQLDIDQKQISENKLNENNPIILELFELQNKLNQDQLQNQHQIQLIAQQYSKNEQEQSNSIFNTNSKLDIKKSLYKGVSSIQQCQFEMKNRDSIQNIINSIYDFSWKLRNVENNFKSFIRGIEDNSELNKEYGISQLKRKNDLANICNKFRRVRGDGNCFYIAFGFQILEILITQYTELEFNDFCEFSRKNISMKIKIKNQKLEITQNQENELMDDFLQRLTELRKITNEFQRQQQLELQFAAYEYKDEDKEINNWQMDGCFYGLSIVFFRNYANYVTRNSDNKEQVIDIDNLLIWEEECNYNEIVIYELSKAFQIIIKLIFFKNGDFKEQIYNENSSQKEIILLIRPGHYNIGIKDNQQQF